MTKKHKAEHYDALAAERTKLDLALHDLLNGRFVDSATLREKDYGTGDGKLVMRASWRGMPLYLVEWICPENEGSMVSVYTDAELDDIARNSLIDSTRMLRDAYSQLRSKYYQRASTAAQEVSRV